MVAISFQPWKTGKVQAGCCQTIRPKRKRQPKIGQRLQLFNQQRVKGKSFKIFDFDPIVTQVTPIEMWRESRGIMVKLEAEKHPMNRQRLKEFAIADGFDDISAFEVWFGRYLEDTSSKEKWSGQLIQWTHPEPFRPSNSDGGEAFMSEWCHKCTRYTEPGAQRQCSSLLASLSGQSPDWIYDLETGDPCCLKFKAKSKRKTRRTIHQMREERGQLNWIATLQEEPAPPRKTEDQLLGLQRKY